ncbi:MAG: hypothetical protein U9Q12_04815 [Patescibacteria group bacterium]|nr:hypothetical protein [Patescibacteria group bacterium]
MSQVKYNPASIQRMVAVKIFCIKSDGVLRAVNCNWNGDGWNVNANSVDDPNEWNDGNRVFSRNSSISLMPYRVGVFFFNPFSQPPSILPISSNFSDNVI